MNNAGEIMINRIQRKRIMRTGMREREEEYEEGRKLSFVDARPFLKQPNSLSVFRIISYSSAD